MKLLILFLFISCAKVSYIAEQGIGQIALEYNDIDNKDFLQDASQNDVHKNKVRIIERAKKYFFDFFELERSDIYDEVKMLDQDAVTYLVIHSPIDKIEAVKSSFPIVGSFPYLGFFSKVSAMEFKSKKEKEGFQTYMRPVYAYSTLNHPLWPFDDNILSSFFFYSDKSLVELVFHELVHTIIFVGDNVGFNENLAQFVAEKLSAEYFNYSSSKLDAISVRKLKQLKLNQFVVKQSKDLNNIYKQKTSDYEEHLNLFLNKTFVPKITSFCEKEKISNCWPLKEKWNNARFAALGTYEGKRGELDELFKAFDSDLKKFVYTLIEKEKLFKNNENETFLDFIKKDLK